MIGLFDDPRVATDAASADTPLLRVEHLTMRFGGLVAVDDVSLVARKREITAIIGPNGAGKTTVFNCLTGFYKPTVGRLTLNRDGTLFYLERMEDFRIAQEARVARTFQNIRLFPAMSVLENLVAGYVSTDLKDTFAFVLLIAVLCIRPEGILGKPIRMLGKKTGLDGIRRSVLRALVDDIQCM